MHTMQLGDYFMMVCGEGHITIDLQYYGKEVKFPTHPTLN